MQQMAQQQLPGSSSAALNSTPAAVTQPTVTTAQPSAEGQADYSEQWAAYYR